MNLFEYILLGIVNDLFIEHYSYTIIYHTIIQK